MTKTYGIPKEQKSRFCNFKAFAHIYWAKDLKFIFWKSWVRKHGKFDSFIFNVVDLGHPPFL